MTKVKWLTGVTNQVLDKEIRDLKGIVANVQERAQVLAVAIIEHDQAHGDCSRAKDLVNALPNREQRGFMTQFLAYFGAIGCKMERNICTEVKHVPTNARNYQRPSIDGAKANNWFEPYDASGAKADWFRGPEKEPQLPGTLGDFGNNIVKMADRLAKQLDDTKDNGRGEEIPFYDLSAEDRQQAVESIAFLRKLGLGVMAREQIATLTPLVDTSDRIRKAVETVNERTDEVTGEQEEALETPQQRAGANR